MAVEAAAVDPEIRVLVESWFDEAIGDVAEGLERAGRFAPPARRLRAVLAMTELDYLARNWTPGRWDTDLEPMLEVLAIGWAGLLTDGEPAKPPSPQAPKPAKPPKPPSPPNPQARQARQAPQARAVLTDGVSRSRSG